MASRFRFVDGRVLSAPTFDCIADVLREFAQLADGAIALTEDCLPGLDFVIQQDIHRFVVVQSDGWNGLLLGQAVRCEVTENAVERGDSIEQTLKIPVCEEQYRVLLEFTPAAIAEFLTALQQTFAIDHPLHQQLIAAIPRIQANSSDRQAQFSLRLAEVLNPLVPPQMTSVAIAPPEHRSRQTQQNTVFSEVATQIRQTSELSFILQTAIQQVRRFLHTDRVVIYEFDAILHPSTTTPISPDMPPGTTLLCGQVTYEDRSTPAIPQILHLSEGMQCFLGIPDYQEKFRKGAIQAITDVRQAYAHAPCLISLLTWAHVQSEVIVPIVYQEKLWGLLIAHQCSGLREWQDSEIQFLQYVTELLAIAIDQNQLYSQLQRQAQTLEQRVIERTQELRDAVNAAQSANISKAEFLATVSHELRTPLTAIIGMATTLLRLPTDERRDKLLPVVKQQEYLQIIRSSGEHLLELINSMIDLSQVEAGRAVLEAQEFSLSQIANECIRMLRDKAQHNQIKLNLDFQVATDLDRFIADPMRIKQILLNLLSNAIKFTPEGGHVTLRVWREGNTTVFQVEDTGIGIPPQQFHLLFKKFQQLDRTYQRQYEGTGLGLALTQQLVELHNGRIDVDSAVDVGSTFTVRIPAQSLKQATDSGKPAPRSTEPIGGRVILVEEDETTATLICDLLTAAGHQVIWMIDGITALRQLEIMQPEAVLVDTHLTGMDVSDFLLRLRKNPLTQTARVLVLLNPRQAHCDRPLLHEAEAHITLPIQQPEELLAKVQQLLADS